MNAAFIPVRGGSKSIPLKNIKLINGQPLVYWSVRAACQCSFIDNVYVATDSDIIRSTVNDIRNRADFSGYEKIIVIDRSADSAADTASTESAMLEFAMKYDFDNIVLIQATSPLLDTSDLNNGFELFCSDGTDSVISVVRQKRFNWDINELGEAYPTNYDVYNRPRRQEFEGYLVENGAFYITSKERLLSTKNRVSGRIKACEMSEDTFFEIDEPDDWNIIEALIRKKCSVPKKVFTGPIKMFLTDCDGCLTDGGMYYSEKGDEIKKFNTCDGVAFALLREKQIVTGVITGEDVELNRRRIEKLGIDEYYPGAKDKAAIIRQLCKKYGITPEQVAYVGDDIADIDAMKAVGFAVAPADGQMEAKKAADYITTAKGGEGVVREAVRLILQLMDENFK